MMIKNNKHRSIKFIKQLQNTENRNVFGIFCEKLKSFEKGVDICVVMVYNVYKERKRGVCYDICKI